MGNSQLSNGSPKVPYLLFDATKRLETHDAAEEAKVSGRAEKCGARDAEAAQRDLATAEQQHNIKIGLRVQALAEKSGPDRTLSEANVDFDKRVQDRLRQDSRCTYDSVHMPDISTLESLDLHISFQIISAVM